MYRKKKRNISLFLFLIGKIYFSRLYCLVFSGQKKTRFISNKQSFLRNIDFMKNVRLQTPDYINSFQITRQKSKSNQNDKSQKKNHVVVKTRARFWRWKCRWKSEYAFAVWRNVIAAIIAGANRCEPAQAYMEYMCVLAVVRLWVYLYYRHRAIKTPSL